MVVLREELERSRAEFLSPVSHELRAPLASIKGSVTYDIGAETSWALRVGRRVTTTTHPGTALGSSDWSRPRGRCRLGTSLRGSRKIPALGTFC